MGLELVEYTIAIEDAFELVIPNRDAARLDSPPRLIDTAIIDITQRPEHEVWRAVAARLGLPAKILTHAPVAQFLAKVVRARGRTIGEVARRLAMLRPAALKRAGGGWTRAQITEVVLKLLQYEIGLSVGQGQLDASFVRDLGMG